MANDGPDQSSDHAGPSSAIAPAVAAPAEVRANLGSRRGTAPTSTRSAAVVPPYRAPFFARAAQPEIIRANQKDLYYLAQLNDQAEEVARTFLGTRWVQTFTKEIGLASRLAYYGLTTLLGSQTLGEEYVDILQYDVRTRKIPTIALRALLLSSHVLAPYFLAHLYTRLKRYIAAQRQAAAVPASINPDHHILNEADPLFSDEPVSPPSVPSLAETTLSTPSSGFSFRNILPLSSSISSFELPAFESLMDEHVRAIHLTVFYLFGRYYHVAKRLVGIRYLSLQGRLNDGSGQGKPPSYEVLGVLMAVQLSVRLVTTLVRRRKAAKAAQVEAKKLAAGGENVDEKAEKDASSSIQRQVATIDGRPVTDLLFDPDDPTPVEDYTNDDDDATRELQESRKCTLCLGPRRDPAATECGHCFCFECIVGWVREKPECPLCRQKVNISRILPLYNV